MFWRTLCFEMLREAAREKKQLNFGFLLKGGGAQPESKAFEEVFKEPFFSLSLEIFKTRGGEVKSKPYEELFQLKFGHFPRKGGGRDQNQNFLRNFCLLDMRLEKKFLEHVQRYRGGGARGFSKNPKLK